MVKTINILDTEFMEVVYAHVTNDTVLNKSKADYEILILGHNYNKYGGYGNFQLDSILREDPLLECAPTFEDFQKLSRSLGKIRESMTLCHSDSTVSFYGNIFINYYNYKENKYTALNGAFWSGGSFIYIPKHVKLDRPLQSYFRIDTENLGQFERTIIIVDDYAELEYIEGCTAKSYSSTSLHAGVVEIYVGKHAKCKYSTIQNWSKDVYNLVTKRAIVLDDGVMEWIDGNIGSGITMKYPSCILKGDNARGNSISIAYANSGQIIDAGAKMIHLGKNTKSNIISKSISLNGGESNYRGTTKIGKNAINSKATVKCDTIILDDKSRSQAIPNNIVGNNSSIIEHEATISKVNKEQLFYLMSKGLSENLAKELLIMGFINDFKHELPMEYAVELNRLIKNY